MLHEIAHGLQLRVQYKADVPTEEATAKILPGFHSRFTKPSDPQGHFLLFKDIESLESAKTKIDSDDDYESVDYVGLKSSQCQVN